MKVLGMGGCKMKGNDDSRHDSQELVQEPD